MDKCRQRKLARQTLAQTSLGQRQEASLRLSQNLKDFLPSLNSKTDIMKDKLIGGYSPLADELDWYLGLTETGLHPCVPSIGEGGEMEFHKVSWALLAREFMGLSLDKGFPLARPGVLVVPGLAFTKDGARLGRGKGFYDRYLERHDVFKIGVCQERQIFETIETEEHDALMDVVITEENIYKG